MEAIIDNIEYKLDSNSYTATVYKCKDEAVQVTIPAQIAYDGNTYRVTEIEESAFSGCESLTSITLPDSVTEIKKKYF